MSFRFSLRAIFGLIFLAAIACTVIFVVPAHVRVIILFLGLIAMPGPLAVLAFQGTGAARTFALGGLVSYVAWFLLVGLPAGFFAIDHFGQSEGAPLSSFHGTVWGTGVPGFSGIIPSYLIYAGIYTPWIVVPAAGICSVLGRMVNNRWKK